MGWSPPATGRYNGKSGVLHFHPGEKCNLDDTEADVPVKTLEDLQNLPPDTTFCKQQGCVFTEEMGHAATLWDPAYTGRWAEEDSTSGDA